MLLPSFCTSTTSSFSVVKTHYQALGICAFSTIAIGSCVHRPWCVLMLQRSPQALFDFPWLWCTSRVQRVSIECGRAGEREQVFVCLFMYEWVTLTDSLCARQLLWHGDRMRSPTAHPRRTYYVRRSSARTRTHTHLPCPRISRLGSRWSRWLWNTVLLSQRSKKVKAGSFYVEVQRTSWGGSCAKDCTHVATFPTVALQWGDASCWECLFSKAPRLPGGRYLECSRSPRLFLHRWSEQVDQSLDYRDCWAAVAPAAQPLSLALYFAEDVEIGFGNMLNAE